MKTAKRTITGIITAAVMLAVGSVWAGDLTPPGAPGSTMHTLEEIYQRQATLEANQAAIEARLDAAGMTEVPSGMVLIPAGDFVMGNATNVFPAGEGGSDELPQHTVSISAFYMGKTEVTKAQWDEVYDWAVTNGYTFENVGSGKATDHPVHTVNWNDCVKWANAQSEMEGLTPCYLAETSTGTVYRAGVVSNPACDWYANGYRLATEAEWEKAARGGALGTRFPWTAVDTIQHTRANYEANIGGFYPYDTSAQGGYHPDYTNGVTPYTSPAGSFAPNGYGLYDMAGNLYEWCWDWYDNGYYTSSPDTDPRGPASGSLRVLRGGYWSNYAYYCRVAYRDFASPGYGSYFLGFRLVRAAQ
jgi:formylglycine-generating enzyme required for sulfatase activity